MPERPPFRETFEDLNARSIAGEFAATCHLAAELWRCSESHFDELRASIARRDATLAIAPVGSPEATNAASNRVGVQNALDRDLAHCAGAPTASFERPWRYLFAAASNGHLPSMLRFVLFPPLDLTLDQDREGVMLYQQHAARFLEDLTRAGNRAAIATLVRAYSGRSSARVGLQIVPADPMLALRYGLISEALNYPGANTRYPGAAPAAMARARLTPEQIATATREADDFVRNLQAATKDLAADNIVNLRVMTDGGECG